MPPLVSIILPCYNNASFVNDAIQSVLNQTYSNIQTIVIDDGSTDGSLSIIRQFGNQIQWKTQPNSGAPTARNRGLELAKGKYIKFLDADDLLLPNSLENQVRQAVKLPDLGKQIVYGDALWVDHDGHEIKGHTHRPRHNGEDPLAHILSQSPLTSCPLHLKEYLVDINGFDPEVPKGQEHDLHLRLVLADVEFVYCPGTIYKYREHSAPERISNRTYSKNGAMVHYELLQKQIKTIQCKTNRTLSPDIRIVMAQRFWAFGRGILREGFVSESQMYFDFALSLAPKECIVGNGLYPHLARLFGPQYAEHMQQRMRTLSSAFRKRI